MYMRVRMSARVWEVVYVRACVRASVSACLCGCALNVRSCVNVCVCGVCMSVVLFVGASVVSACSMLTVRGANITRAGIGDTIISRCIILSIRIDINPWRNKHVHISMTYCIIKATTCDHFLDM